MRFFSILMTLLLCTAFTGCIFNDSEGGFEWPEPTDFNCDLSPEYNLECGIFLEGSETPHHSVINPENGNLWIIYLNGNVKSWDGSSMNDVANLTSFVSTCHIEQGLLGLAFDENYNNSRTVLLSFTESEDCDGTTTSDLILASVLIGDDGIMDSSTITVLREIQQPYRNHNGGHLLNIGDNQYLWGIGDGGGANDPQNNSQNITNSLGSINLFTYQNNTISPVFEDSNGDPFILHYGLRNPWRFSLGENDLLWIADVGQNCWEEINLVPISERMNLGWSLKEGFQYFDEDGDCYEEDDHDAHSDDDLTYPVVTYGHGNGNCSITGGFWMDWGPEKLQNGYLYGDFCSGSIWLLKEINGEWVNHFVGTSGGMIVGFGQGLADELLVFYWTGNIGIIR